MIKLHRLTDGEIQGWCEQLIFLTPVLLNEELRLLADKLVKVCEKQANIQHLEEMIEWMTVHSVAGEPSVFIPSEALNLLKEELEELKIKKKLLRGI